MKRNIKLKGRLRNYMCWPLLLTVLLVAMNIPLYVVDALAGGMFSIFTGIYFLIVCLSYQRNKPVLVRELINFATQYGTVQKKLLNEFEVPYILIDDNGKILWVNEQFTAITGKGKNYHKSITSIFPSVTKELLQKQDEFEDIHITLGDRIYRTSLSKLYFDTLAEANDMIAFEQSEQFLTAMYLFDETELNHYIQENKDERMIASLIYIDNYEEALDSIEEVKRSLLVALVDRKINKYFSGVDALVRKIEKDKYFVVFRHKFLSRLQEDKFSLLEDVKNVRVGNEMAVIDLALGRGGDQVVVKEGEKISYYGGKSKQVEKMTRVKARVKAHALREMIESREHVIVMGHNISDVDSFGAAIGVYCAARELGKRCQIVLNEVTSSLRPLKECFTPSWWWIPTARVTPSVRSF